MIICCYVLNQAPRPTLPSLRDCEFQSLSGDIINMKFEIELEVAYELSSRLHFTRFSLGSYKGGVMS